MTGDTASRTIELSTASDGVGVHEEVTEMDPLVVVLAQLLKIILEEEARASGSAA